MGETKEHVRETALLIIECITNELARGTKHFDERKLEQGITEEVIDMREILELMKDNNLIIEPVEGT